MLLNAMHEITCNTYVNNTIVFIGHDIYEVFFDIEFPLVNLFLFGSWSTLAED